MPTPHNTQVPDLFLNRPFKCVYNACYKEWQVRVPIRECLDPSTIQFATGAKETKVCKGGRYVLRPCVLG